MNPSLDQRGVLHVPLAMIALLIVLTGVGLWALLHHWKTLTRTQLRLDRCTGEAALELKSKLTQIGSINSQMKKLRALESAADAQPEVRAALFAAVNVEALRQEAVRAQWELKRALWIAQSGCGTRGDVSGQFPALQWTREPPDDLGERPLVLEELPTAFHFEVYHYPRASASEVFRGGKDGVSTISDFAGIPGTHTASWHARWVAPRGSLRPGIY